MYTSGFRIKSLKAVESSIMIKKSDFRIEMKKMLNNMLLNWKNFKGHWTMMKNSRISCFTNPMIVLLQPILLRRNVTEVLLKCPLLPTFAHFCPPLPTFFHFCPLLSTFVHFCPLLPTSTHLYPDTHFYQLLLPTSMQNSTHFYSFHFYPIYLSTHF